MKIKTPMALLKTNFESLKTLIKEPIELNKTSPKTHYSRYEYKTSKGVKNDFIRIYPLTKTESFSFAFNGLEAKSGTILASWMIKTEEGKENIYQQQLFNFETFKIKLKAFVKTLEILKTSKILNKKSMKETFISIFDIKNGKIQIKEEIDKFIEDIKEQTKELKQTLSSNKRKSSKYNNNLINEKSDYLIKKKSIEIELGIDKLEKELIAKKIELKKRLQTKTSKINSLEKKKKAADFLTRKSQIDYDYFLSQLIKNCPIHIRKDILKKI